ncbi:MULTISPECIES: hypothetical protein [unclassified Streptomyces]|uniref:SCO4983 family protein n=1 Tax=unclassified Streptomyces TaxID=2593676 RepID=UPI002033B864|nr:hypothetical protein [Streptomyces sp. RKAG290]MCM2412095.1 hypothetical protein [Streptomyces sp. RKAG290]
MYEPIRTKSVHTPADHAADFPHRSREEELDIQLAGHLAALLAVTDELGLGEAGDRIAEQVARLRGAPPARHAGLTDAPAPALHRRAHALAGRALVVAASRADTAVAILSAERMDAHTAAVSAAASADSPAAPPRLVGAL